MTPRKLLRLLREAGFVEDHQTGSHLILIHPQDKRRAVETIHTRDLPKGTMHSILKQAGLKFE
ncbi:MAG: type II toxin-antitoxin system HicA family toxin [Planctomycetes bacterium]|nr:type II toxin-antitoxin system HicA family toxin [Planctomycetota bacterium]